MWSLDTRAKEGLICPCEVWPGNTSCCEMQKSEAFSFYSASAAVPPSWAGRGTDLSMQWLRFCFQPVCRSTS